MTKTCPDCETVLEMVDYDASHSGTEIRLRAGDGVLGSFGLRGKKHVRAYLCPDCRRVLFYAAE